MGSPGFFERVKEALRVKAQKSGPPRVIYLTDGFIDGLPPNMPEDVPSDTPVTIVRRKVGIAGIDATLLRPRTWELLNEANSCYSHYEYYACISILQSALESWLIDLFDERGMKPSDTFKRAIDVAKNKGIITDEEAKLFDRLRGFRNTFVHSKEESWMVPEITEMTDPPKPLSKEFLNTGGSKDMVALMLGAEMAWGYLTEVLRLMRNRYPTKGVYPYWVSQVIHHVEPKTNLDKADGTVGQQWPGNRLWWRFEFPGPWRIIPDGASYLKV
jgi:hypothetical protein